MIHACLQVKEGCSARYEDTFSELRELVLHHEAGCTFFELARDAQVPLRYHVFEAYTDEGAIQAHVEAPWYAPTARVFVECLAGDHLCEIDRRGLAGRDMFKVVKGIVTTRHELL